MSLKLDGKEISSKGAWSDSTIAEYSIPFTKEMRLVSIQSSQFSNNNGVLAKNKKKPYYGGWKNARGLRNLFGSADKIFIIIWRFYF